MRADVARVHPLVQEVDGLALAGAVHAAHQHGHGETGIGEQAVLRLEQRLAQRRRLALEVCLADLVADFGGGSMLVLAGILATGFGVVMILVVLLITLFGPEAFVSV